MMDSKNALENLIQNEIFFDSTEDVDTEESFNFNELESKLEEELEVELGELEFLKEEKEKIGSPDALGETIKGVVWEQFINQIAVTAGEDFIKENNGLHLDLSKEAHYQTTENFASGKIATHNTEIDYQKRYDDWQANFQRDEKGNIKTTYDNRSGKQKETLRVKDTKKDPDGKDYNHNFNARADFDKGRETGKNGKQKDHTISAAEIIRDPEANAHLSREEQVAFANSDKNLNDLDSAANQSKGDSTMSEFLDSERDGKKPTERFDIDENELRKKDKEAREEYEKVKKDGEQRSQEAGKISRRKEAFRIGGAALRAILMQMLAELVKEIIGKLVKWFKESQKNLKTLLASIKEAILSFISKLKTHIINAGNTVVSTIATAIIGPVFGLIKKVWTMLKQGWKALKDAIAFIKDPNNKNMPFDRKLLEVGKIVIAGLTGVGALLLGEIIEKGLMALPGIGAVFAFEIPLLGSLASLLGVFLGAVVAGIIGAIAINLIQKKIEKKQKAEIQDATIEKGNQIIATQHKLQIVNKVQLERNKENAQTNISKRHQAAATILKDAYENIMEDFVEDFSEITNTLVIDEEDVITNNEINKNQEDLNELLKDLNK